MAAHHSTAGGGRGDGVRGMSDHLNRMKSGLANEYTELMIIAVMNSCFAFAVFVCLRPFYLNQRLAYVRAMFLLRGRPRPRRSPADSLRIGQRRNRGELALQRINKERGGGK